MRDAFACQTFLFLSLMAAAAVIGGYNLVHWPALYCCDSLRQDVERLPSEQLWVQFRMWGRNEGAREAMKFVTGGAKTEKGLEIQWSRCDSSGDLVASASPDVNIAVATMVSLDRTISRIAVDIWPASDSRWVAEVRIPSSDVQTVAVVQETLQEAVHELVLRSVRDPPVHTFWEWTLLQENGTDLSFPWGPHRESQLQVDTFLEKITNSTGVPSSQRWRVHPFARISNRRPVAAGGLPGVSALHGCPSWILPAAWVQPVSVAPLSGFVADDGRERLPTGSRVVRAAAFVPDAAYLPMAFADRVDAVGVAGGFNWALADSTTGRLTIRPTRQFQWRTYTYDARANNKGEEQARGDDRISWTVGADGDVSADRGVSSVEFVCGDTAVVSDDEAVTIVKDPESLSPRPVGRLLVRHARRWWGLQSLGWPMWDGWHELASDWPENKSLLDAVQVASWKIGAGEQAAVRVFRRTGFLSDRLTQWESIALRVAAWNAHQKRIKELATHLQARLRRWDTFIPESVRRSVEEASAVLAQPRHADAHSLWRIRALLERASSDPTLMSDPQLPWMHVLSLILPFWVPIMAPVLISLRNSVSRMRSPVLPPGGGNPIA